MIIEIDIYAADGLYKIRSEDTEHVTTDKAEYLFTLLNKKFTISKNLNRGMGFIDSQINFDLDDTDGIWNAMLDDRERGILEGRKVIIYGYKEELNGSWALVEKFRYTGKIATANKIDVNQMHFLVTSMYSELDMVVPNNMITEVEYPDAMDSSFGKYMAWIYGNVHALNGNIKAYNIAPNKYLLSGIDLTVDNAIVKNIYWQNIKIGKELWGTYAEGGRMYVTYVPPTSDDELPATDVESISCTVETEKINPVLVLKDVLYRRTGSYDFFNGDAAIETDFTTREIKFAGAIKDGDPVRGFITEFCSEFNLYSYITDDDKLKIISIGGASTQTFTDDNGTIVNIREEVIKGEIVNDVIFKGQYNFSENKFIWEENYKHGKSIGLLETRKGEKFYYFVEDKNVAIKLIKEYIQQKKYNKKKIFIDTKYTDVENRKLGDTISVRSKYVSGIKLKDYIITKMETELIGEDTSIEAITYISETDCIVDVRRNRYGGEINLLGMNAVQSGQTMTINIEPLSGFTIGYYWLDGMKYAGSSEITLTNITADHDVFIVFDTIKYAIIASTDGNVTITPEGQIMVTSGANQSFTAGAGFDYFLKDGDIDHNNPCTFLDVTNNHTIIAHGSQTYSETITLTCTFDSAKGDMNDPYNYPSRELKLHSRVWIFFYPKDTFDVTLVKRNGIDVTAAAKSQGKPYGLYLGYLDADELIEVTFE